MAEFKIPIKVIGTDMIRRTVEKITYDYEFDETVPDEFKKGFTHFGETLIETLNAFGNKDTEICSINQMAYEIHQNAKAHGWWDEERSFGEIIALCHSELSEALEAYRNGETLEWNNNGKPDGMAVEMIDCVIRIFDYLAKENVDIERIITEKHRYNISRPYKHGGKKI